MQFTLNKIQLKNFHVIYSKFMLGHGQHEAPYSNEKGKFIAYSHSQLSIT